MPTYTVKLNDRKPVADGTTAFHFEKPTGFMYKPGQFIELTAINPEETDAEGNTRAFSLASAPSEDFLMVATRMRDTAFKRYCGKTPVGTPFKIEGPFGDLTLHRNTARTGVFLAGGIGITPFRSMVVQAAREKSPHRLCLFYSNRRRSGAAFLDEMQALEKQNPNYTFVATMTAKEPLDGWRGETDYIDREMLSRYLGNLSGPLYYVAGPPEMVGGLRQMLIAAEVSEDDIRAEEFAGY